MANASLLDKTVNFEVEFVFFEDEPFVYIDSTYDDDGNFVVSDTFLISGVGTLNLDSWYTASSQSEFVTVIFADEPTEEEAGKAMPKNYFVEKNLPGKSVSFLTPKYMAKKHGLSKAKSEKAAAKTVRNIQKKLAH